MSFPNAIKLLRQRREEIVRQMDRMLDGVYQGSNSRHNNELKLVQQKYKEVEEEIKVLEQL